MSRKDLRSIRRSRTNSNFDSDEDVIQEILRQSITFHGTPRHNVSSIVQYGFKLPGTTVEDLMIVSPRSGIAFQNPGIYSSPESFFALSFAQAGALPTSAAERPGLRLFICATLMGRCYTGPHVHSSLRSGFDSHMTDSGLEYIVHDPAQVLPCFVVYLNLSTEAAARTMVEAQTNPMTFMEAQKRDLFGVKRMTVFSPQAI